MTDEQIHVKLLTEIVEVLKAVEWIQDEECNFAYCPKCDRPTYKGHTPDCRLKALLDKLKEIEDGDKIP